MIKIPYLIEKGGLITNHIKKSYESLFNARIAGMLFDIRICSNCGGRVYWEIIKKLPKGCNPEEITTPLEFETEIIKIYPFISSIDDIPDKNMSEEEITLFNEAKNIFDQSPKSSAALLRSVLEDILRRIFTNHSNSMLGTILTNKDVQAKLGSDILDVCKACKIIGNQGAHSSLLIYKEEDINDVKILFKLVNLVAKKLITIPLEEKELLDISTKIIEKSKEK